MSIRTFHGSSCFVVAIALSLHAVGAEPEKLPIGVKPTSYNLVLVPDADKLVFSGRVQIGIDVSSPTDTVVINQDGLVVDKATIDGAQTAAAIRLDPKLQTAAITFGRAVSTGQHSLSIDYHGPITKTTVGFFAMDYDSAAGRRRTLATNFEPASERRFMPSWDEPALKATLALTVEIPSDRMAVSNMPIESTESVGSRQRIHFATTPKMSTYLFFLGIGDFERISAKSDGTDIGVVVNRGDTSKGQFALGEAAHLLHYYNGYFGVAYPLPKLDLIVAPGLIAGGAMENWGAIFYSQSSLLFDPKHSTESARQGVFGTVAHEMAHQWFGDLVTMAWWDNLWLNEGFARWMQTVAADELHPEWNTGLQALAIFERGKHADAKPSTHPILQPVLDAAQAEQAFDGITYDKGASVITMLEKYVGAEAFRDGVRSYMRTHAYGNTVDADLWQAVQASAGKPVVAIEHDFTTQPGLPLIRVGEFADENKRNYLRLTYERFFEDRSNSSGAPSQSWHIPVTLNLNGKSSVVLLQSPDGNSAIALPDNGPAVVNAGQSTFVRTLYSEPLLARIRGNLASLQPVDQIGILNDSWAVGQSGYAPVTDYLSLAQSTPPDADALVWMQIASTFERIDALYPATSGRAKFRTFALSLLSPIAARLGWEPHPGEAANTARLRNTVLQTLARLGDSPIISEAQKRFDAALADSEGMSPATRRVVLAIAVSHGNAAVVDRTMAKIRALKDPLEKQNLTFTLTQVLDPVQAERVIDSETGSDENSGYTPWIFDSIADKHPDLAWYRALRYLSGTNASVDPQIQLILMPHIASQSADSKRIAELQAYANQHIPATARRYVESAVSTINMNAKFRSDRIPEIDQWLARNETSNHSNSK